MTKLAKATFDLHDLVDTATKRFALESIHLFGSRRHKTRSLRSDIDIFFIPKSPIQPMEIREFIADTCIALDIFLLDRGRAVSALNESYVELVDNDAVLRATAAVMIWADITGCTADSDIEWIQEYAEHVPFAGTAMPNFAVTESVDALRARLRKEGLPDDPIVGENEDQVAARLIEVARTIAEFKPTDFSPKGSARTSFAVNPSSEYDYQDVFWIAVKPWVRSVAREQIEIRFDGQKKLSDFSLADSRFIIEMKLAKNKNDARAIVKTLDGLANFYGANGNVRTVLFIIYARSDAQIDRTAWESKYSNYSGRPRTIVKVLSVK